jgi:hypothetical protein
MFARDVLQSERQPVRTRRVLDHTPSAVQPVQKRARRYVDRDRLVLQRAFKKCDDRRSARAVLGVGGITNSGQVQCVLDQHVLKATSSTDQRNVPLARLSHDRVSSFGIAVRRAGPDDDRRSSCCDPGRVTNRVGGHDPNLDWEAAMLRRVPEGGQSCAMIRVIRR